MRFLSFLILIFFYTSTFSQSSDMRLLEKLNAQRNTKLDGTFKFVTNANNYVNLGSIGSLVTIGLLKKDDAIIRKGLLLVTSQFVSIVVTKVGKISIQRERPFLVNSNIHPYKLVEGYAMPSGHASSAFANATAISIAYPKWYVIAPAFTYASLVGYSRLHLGVHYPSDVLVGALVGSGSALLSNYLVKKLCLKNKTIKKEVL